MRNLAVKIVTWLCARYGIVPLDETRRFMGEDAKARSVRWEAFALEQGGLFDFIADIRLEAFEAAAELDPKDTDKIYYWATADRNLRKLEQRIRSKIQSGKIEAANDAALERMSGASIIKSVR